jgi:hypothetical protein
MNRERRDHWVDWRIRAHGCRSSPVSPTFLPVPDSFELVAGVAFLGRSHGGAFVAARNSSPDDSL